MNSRKAANPYLTKPKNNDQKILTNSRDNPHFNSRMGRRTNSQSKITIIIQDNQRKKLFMKFHNKF